MFQLTDKDGKNITDPYQESAKIKFSQISVLDNDNNVKLNDNNLESNSYIESLMNVYKRIRNEITERSKKCGTFDVMCLLRESKEENSSSFASNPVPIPKASSGFIDIDNGLENGDVAHPRKVRSVKGRRGDTYFSDSEDDEDNLAAGSGYASSELEGSGEESKPTDAGKHDSTDVTRESS